VLLTGAMPSIKGAFASVRGAVHLGHAAGNGGQHSQASLAPSDDASAHIETIEDLQTLIFNELGDNCCTVVTSFFFLVLSVAAVTYGIACVNISNFHRFFLCTAILFFTSTLFHNVQAWRVVVYCHARDHIGHPPPLSLFARHDRTWWFIMGLGALIGFAGAMFGLIHEFEVDVRDKNSYKLFLVIAYIFSIVSVTNLAMVLQDRFERSLWEDECLSGGHHSAMVQHNAEQEHSKQSGAAGSWHLPSILHIRSQPRHVFHAGRDDEEHVAHTLSNALSTMHDTIGCWPYFFAVAALVCLAMLALAIYHLSAIYLLTVMFGGLLLAAGTCQLTKLSEDNDDNDDNNHFCAAALVLLGGIIALTVAICICPATKMPVENKLTCALALIVTVFCVFCATRLHNRKERLEVLKEHHTDEFSNHKGSDELGHKKSFFDSILSSGKSKMHLPGHWGSHNSKPITSSGGAHR